MKPSLLFVLLISFAFKTKADDYTAYQRCLNRVDDYLIANDPERAALVMDSVGTKYRFVFAQHCFKALQIACTLKDSVRADYWLRRSLLRGVPMWMLRYNELTRVALSFRTTQYTLAHQDSFRKVYEASVNHDVKHRLDSLMIKDQRFTRKVNNGFFVFRHTLYGLQWIHSNTRVFRELRDIIRQYGYPGEQLIGLDTRIGDSAMLEPFMRQEGAGLVLAQRSALIMLLHYTSTRRQDFTALLYPSVSSGYLPADQYGRINDYLVNNSGKTTEAYRNYYVFDNNHKESPDSVNTRREAIGLNTVQEQERNRALRLEWRKGRTTNRQIILE